MLRRKKLYVVLGAMGAALLLFGALGGTSIVSAQETVPQSEDAPGRGGGGRLPGPLGLGNGGDWTTFDTAADVLGLTPQELFSALHAGQTLEEIAEAQGVELEDLQEAVSSTREEARREAIEQALQNGEISQEEADWLLEGLEQGFTSGARLGHDFGEGRGRGGPGRPPAEGGESEHSE